MLRLGNIATVSREWAAVKRLQFLPMRDMLLQGGARDMPTTRQMQVPGGLMQHLRRTYNESQLQAVTAGLDGRPFVLIQGPPGTGKTQCAPPPPNLPSIRLVLMHGAHARSHYRLNAVAALSVRLQGHSQRRCRLHAVDPQHAQRMADAVAGVLV